MDNLLKNASNNIEPREPYDLVERLEQFGVKMVKQIKNEKYRNKIYGISGFLGLIAVLTPIVITVLLASPLIVANYILEKQHKKRKFINKVTKEFKVEANTIKNNYKIYKKLEYVKELEKNDKHLFYQYSGLGLQALKTTTHANVSELEQRMQKAYYLLKIKNEILEQTIINLNNKKIDIINTPLLSDLYTSDYYHPIKMSESIDSIRGIYESSLKNDAIDAIEIESFFKIYPYKGEGFESTRAMDEINLGIGFYKAFKLNQQSKFIYLEICADLTKQVVGESLTMPTYEYDFHTLGNNFDEKKQTKETLNTIRELQKLHEGNGRDIQKIFKLFLIELEKNELYQEKILNSSIELQSANKTIELNFIEYQYALFLNQKLFIKQNGVKKILEMEELKELDPYSPTARITDEIFFSNYVFQELEKKGFSISLDNKQKIQNKLIENDLLNGHDIILSICSNYPINIGKYIDELSDRAKDMMLKAFNITHIKYLQDLIEYTTKYKFFDSSTMNLDKLSDLTYKNQTTLIELEKEMLNKNIKSNVQYTKKINKI